MDVNEIEEDAVMAEGGEADSWEHPELCATRTLRLIERVESYGGVVELPEERRFQVGRHYALDASGLRLRARALSEVRGREGNGFALGLDGLLWPRNREAEIAERVRDLHAEGTWDEGVGPFRRPAGPLLAMERMEEGLVVIDAFNGNLSGVTLSSLRRYGFSKGLVPVYLGLEWCPSAFGAFAEAHPQLAWFVAQRVFDEEIFAAGRTDDLARLLELGPRRLAVWLGMPDRPASLRLLRRLSLRSLGIPLTNLGPLPSIAANDRLLRLAFEMPQPAFSEFVPEGMCPSPEVLTFLATLEPETDEWHEAADMLFHWRAEEPLTLATLRSVRRFRDGPEGARFGNAQRLPEPPFPPESGSAETTFGAPATVRELRRLGRVLRNCLGHTGVESVVDGQQAIYPVSQVGAVVAVFSLERISEGGWQLENCLAAENHPPTPEVLAFVTEFCRRHGIAPTPGSPE